MPPYTIRPATLGDAPAINAHLRQIADEPNNMISYSRGEYARTVAEERARLVDILTANNSHFLVATVDDQIVGVCICVGGVRAKQHTTGLGIMVHADWRNQGVGSALLQTMIAWARANPVIHRLEFTVFAHNDRALHVYRKLGFSEEGIQREVYFKDGRFRDVLMMAMLFD